MDPLRLVAQIPCGLAIPRLRDRLVHIIADFRTQTSLREGCNTILHHDCLHLAQARRPLCAVPREDNASKKYKRKAEHTYCSHMVPEVCVKTW